MSGIGPEWHPEFTPEEITPEVREAIEELKLLPPGRPIDSEARVKARRLINRMFDRFHTETLEFDADNFDEVFDKEIEDVINPKEK